MNDLLTWDHCIELKLFLTEFITFKKDINKTSVVSDEPAEVTARWQVTESLLHSAASTT